jgi:SAM-dependent methyltransferase
MFFHCYSSMFDMAQDNSLLKERVRAFWQQNPCGTKFADASPGSRRFYELVEEHRYKKEWHIPAAAGFANSKDLSVLEVGCGLGTDGAQFAKAGAKYTGIDLTDAAVDLAKRRFELFNLPGTFRVADAERLLFANNSFDIVYSHGVLHHTPDTAAAVREIHRVLRPGGKAVVMLYHRDSYNYRVNISLLRRAGVNLLKWNAGVKLVHLLTGEAEERLREHARLLKIQSDYSNSEEFLSQNTDGAGNPLARVYSRSEARELFRDFSTVEMRSYFLNKRWLPLFGPILPRSVESRLASRWGWHLWIYATKEG